MKRKSLGRQITQVGMASQSVLHAERSPLSLRHSERGWFAPADTFSPLFWTGPPF
jgi:hypothetical protein